MESGFEEFAYEDGALPIANHQTISQPYIVALMTEAAELKPTDKVLEVGTGSGYAAAIASRLAKTVHTIERHGTLARSAAQRLSALGCANCIVHTGDGTRGLAHEVPFDAILVAAGGPSVPDALKRQLAVGGRLVIPVGNFEDEQSLLRITRRARMGRGWDTLCQRPRSRSHAIAIADGHDPCCYLTVACLRQSCIRRAVRSLRAVARHLAWAKPVTVRRSSTRRAQRSRAA